MKKLMIFITKFVLFFFYLSTHDGMSND